MQQGFNNLSLRGQNDIRDNVEMDSRVSGSSVTFFSPSPNRNSSNLSGTLLCMPGAMDLNSSDERRLLNEGSTKMPADEEIRTCFKTFPLLTSSSCLTLGSYVSGFKLFVVGFDNFKKHERCCRQEQRMARK